MRKYLVVFWMFLIPVAPATAETGIGFDFFDGNIGINLQLFPELEQVPGYPVYYAPRLDSNYFFYDGMYWVYLQDDWYSSTWYNGPWWRVDPEDVPYFVLRIPVRYYRQPPMYFQGWQVNAPPRWRDHWGSSWAQRRSGWDRWDRSRVHAPAPLPVYQRNYSGARYPAAEQQRMLHIHEYRYQPRDPIVRKLEQKPRTHAAPAPVRRETPGLPNVRNPAQHNPPHVNPPPPAQNRAPTPPHPKPRQQIEKNVEQPAPAQDRQQKDAVPVQQNRHPKNEAIQHRPPEFGLRESGPQGKGAPQETRREQKSDKKKDHANSDESDQRHGR